MPNPIFPNMNEGDTAGSIIERVLGRDANQRQTKTWIPSTTLINRLGVLRNHSTRLTATFRVLALRQAIEQHQQANVHALAMACCDDHEAHKRQHAFNRNAQHCACGWQPLNPTDKELAEQFTCIQSYRGLHQEVLEHLGSYKGFLVRSTFGRGDDDAPTAPVSSAGATPAQPAQGVKPVPSTPQTNGMAMK